MNLRVWTVLGAVMVVNAQRANNGATCDTGTPIPFESDGAWGYATTTGITIPPQFKTAMRFSDGVAAVCTPQGCGLINAVGRLITPLRNSRVANLATRYSEGVGPFVKDKMWGYVDLSENVVIFPKFEHAGDFESGIAPVRLNGKCFFINHKGDRITPEFDGLSDFNDDLAAAIVGDKVGYINRDGSFALSPKYHGTSGIDFSEGLVAVRIDGKVGFIDKTGSIIVKPSYDDAYPFSEGLAAVRTGDTWGYIDRTGNMAIPSRYRIGHMFNEGVASVNLVDTGKWGYIDHTGALAVPPLFDAATPFCAGLAQVATYRRIGREPDDLLRRDRFEGKLGLIDHSGKYIWRDPADRVRIGPF